MYPGLCVQELALQQVWHLTQMALVGVTSTWHVRSGSQQPVKHPRFLFVLIIILRDTELPSASSLPQRPETGWGRAEARRRELTPVLLCGWQEPATCSFTWCFLPYQQEAGVRGAAGVESRDLGAEYKCLSCQPKPPTQFFLSCSRRSVTTG